MQHKFTVFEKIDNASIAIKHYTIGCRDGEIWLENEGGEGMTVSEKNLFDVLDEYFRREF